ncbi:hypothetical protein COP2_002574 [Malus domestica]
MSFVEDLWPWLDPLGFLEKSQLFKESILQSMANTSCGSTELEACSDDSATSKNEVLLFEGRMGRNGVEMQIEKTVHEAAGESTTSLVGGSHNVPPFSPQHRLCSALVFKCRNYPPPPPQPPQQ